MSVALEPGRVDRALRTLPTPEGVDLPVRLAELGERLGALLIDLVILGIAMFLLVLLGVFSVFSSEGVGGAGLPIFVVFLFLLRVFYFPGFELAWGGRSPGKRLLQLRVIDHRGGPLTADAVLARNFMREIEIFGPLQLLVLAGNDGWMVLGALGWIAVVVAIPLFGRNRMRIGDLVGGTWVIATPRAVLLPDLGAAGATAAAPLTFTDRQLDTYGIYELQVLEQVLRRTDPGAAETMEEVAARIRRRLAYTPPVGTTTRVFLTEFYAQLRNRLERDLAFGVRRQNKFDRRTSLAARGAARAEAGGAPRFTARQLSIYGPPQLKALTAALAMQGPAGERTRAEIATAIKQKIGWTDPDRSPQHAETPHEVAQFLTSYRESLAAHLDESQGAPPASGSDGRRRRRPSPERAQA